MKITAKLQSKIGGWEEHKLHNPKHFLDGVRGSRDSHRPPFLRHFLLSQEFKEILIISLLWLPTGTPLGKDQFHYYISTFSDPIATHVNGANLLTHKTRKSTKQRNKQRLVHKLTIIHSKGCRDESNGSNYNSHKSNIWAIKGTNNSAVAPNIIPNSKIIFTICHQIDIYTTQQHPKLQHNSSHTTNAPYRPSNSHLYHATTDQIEA